MQERWVLMFINACQWGVVQGEILHRPATNTTLETYNMLSNCSFLWRKFPSSKEESQTNVLFCDERNLLQTRNHHSILSAFGHAEWNCSKKSTFYPRLVRQWSQVCPPPPAIHTGFTTFQAGSRDTHSGLIFFMFLQHFIFFCVKLSVLPGKKYSQLFFSFQINCAALLLWQLESSSNAQGKSHTGNVWTRDAPVFTLCFHNFKGKYRNHPSISAP